MKSLRIFGITLGCAAIVAIALMFGFSKTETVRYFRVAVETDVSVVQDKLAAEMPETYWASEAEELGAEDTMEFEQLVQRLVPDLSYVDSGSLVMIEVDRNDETKSPFLAGYRIPLDAVPALSDQAFCISEDVIFANVILRTTSEELMFFGRHVAESIAWEDMVIEYKWNICRDDFVPYSMSEPFEYFFKADQDDFYERQTTRGPVEFNVDGVRTITFFTDNITSIPKVFEVDFVFMGTGVGDGPNSDYFTSGDNVLWAVLPNEINGISMSTETGTWLPVKVDDGTAALPELNAYSAIIELADSPETEDYGWFTVYTYEVVSFIPVD